MTAFPLFAAQHGELLAPDDFAGWRDQARTFLAAGVAPEQIIWSVRDADSGDMFAQEIPTVGGEGDAGLVRISRDSLGMLRTALMHSAPSRFALAYRLLWRMRLNPELQRDPSDPDMIALRKLSKAVRRDMHKMHAFVRFRKVGEANGREQFAAWFEPDHHITRATAGFFRDRFTGMDWLIVTPQASIGWDREGLRCGPGGTRGDVPGEDAVEAEWRAYYASIFNPARLKVNAMKREMPVRYWRNLPEAALIPDLVEDAGKRTEAMIERKRPEPDLFGGVDEAAPHEERRFDNLDALYAALRDEDIAPSDHFSDHIVLGEGPLHAPLLFVGEQPGDQEDVEGRPFVGPAGQLLDECLKEAGIAREDCFLTNAVKRFKFLPRGKRRIHQTPTAGDVAHYRWWLGEEIRLVGPKVIVSLGATALHALTGKKQALGPVRGTVMAGSSGHLLPTVHPSYLLRLPDRQAREIEYGKFVRDLSAALKAAARD